MKGRWIVFYLFFCTINCLFLLDIDLNHLPLFSKSDFWTHMSVWWIWECCPDKNLFELILTIFRRKIAILQSTIKSNINFQKHDDSLSSHQVCTECRKILYITDKFLLPDSVTFYATRKLLISLKHEQWVNKISSAIIFKSFVDFHCRLYCWYIQHVVTTLSLQWRHNERDGVSNHRVAIVCSNVCHWLLWGESTGGWLIPLTKGL